MSVSNFVSQFGQAAPEIKSHSQNPYHSSFDPQSYYANQQNAHNRQQQIENERFELKQKEIKRLLQTNLLLQTNEGLKELHTAMIEAEGKYQFWLEMLLKEDQSE